MRSKREKLLNLQNKIIHGRGDNCMGSSKVYELLE
jgi:hypothetical protein